VIVRVLLAVFMFKIPEPLMVRLLQVEVVLRLTVAPETIITSSVATGATPPTQLPPVVQLPPPAVLVIVAACDAKQINNPKNRKIALVFLISSTMFFQHSV